MSSLNKEEIQKQVQTYAKDVQVKGQSFFNNVKQGKFEEEDLRFATLGLLGIFGIVGLILPGFWTLVFGSGWGNVSVESDWMRLVSIPTLVFALITYMSESWDEKARNDILKANAVLFASLSVLSIIILFYGSLKFTIFLVALACGGLGFFNAKVGGLLGAKK
eukprot:gb/GECH01011571.1/.p1 GENE.gb/GECH01011571.1/~~gb/GECH01011571.1/.p1  ORF type:complete len:163 (+),score=33.46 gb/GECH01011571.1/:1-489(+)